MSHPSPGRRQRRVADLIQREMSGLLQRGLKDRRIAALTTVTDVKVSSDFRYATIRVSVLGDERAQRGTLIALTHAAGYIQHELGQTLQLRFTPQVRFELDDRIAEGDRILGLMAELRRERDDDTIQDDPHTTRSTTDAADGR